VTTDEDRVLRSHTVSRLVGIKNIIRRQVRCVSDADA